MNLSALLSYLGKYAINFSGDMNTEVSGAASDSREVKPGFLFCAMKGAVQDGHDFVEDAIAKGAAAVMLEHPLPLPKHIPWIQVINPYQSIGLLAEAVAQKPADSLNLLAVTGTNGKTTSAYLLRAILKKAGFNAGMIGTVEYDLGNNMILGADRTTPTPFCLQKLFQKLTGNNADWVSIELSSHALEQGRLGTAKCAAALFTNLTQDHLDYHLTMENYYQAKKLLFTKHLKYGAPAIINADDSYGARLAGELPRQNMLAFSFSEGSMANVRASIGHMDAGGATFTMNFPDGDIWIIDSPLTGIYNIQNTAGAVAAAKALNLPKEAVLEAIASCQGAPGRLQKVPVNNVNFSIFVDYAHTDDALSNVLSNLKKLPHRKLFVVFGCGGDRDRKKRPLMAKAAASLADYVIVTSDNPRTEKPEDIIKEIEAGLPAGADFVSIVNRKDAICHALSSAKAGDIVLIAGKGHEDYQEINGVKHHFNDLEVATDFLTNISR